MMSKLLHFKLLLGFLLIVSASQSQNLEDKIPLNPNLRYGKLENGLTYYIQKNAKPENRVELRLAVNVGSVQEDEDQLGLAHFVEHMAFNGTDNFKKNELVSYLQSAGVKFGNHLNAYTSFDETVYILPIPSDNKKLLDNGLQILRDWAFGITFEGEEIDKERGIIEEEWRYRRDAQSRLFDETRPTIFYNSRYAERLPIGKMEIIRNFNHDVIRRYYKDWYRPDLMAVIVVGDIDVESMEKKIKKKFGKIKFEGTARERSFYEVPDHSNTLVKTAQDKESPFTRVSVMYKNAKKKTPVYWKDYRIMIMEMLAEGMMNDRFEELAEKSQPPFINAYAYNGDLGRTKESFVLSASVSEDGIRKGLQTLLEEGKRVKQYGFTEGEFKRAKINLINQYERAYNERNKTKSEAYATEYRRNFLNHEPAPGIEAEYMFIKNYLDKINLEEVNKMTQGWIHENNRVVLAMGPEKESMDMPSETVIKAIIKQVDERTIEAYNEEEVASSFMSHTPSPGSIVSEKKIEALGVVELTLSNGTKVVLKPTDFKDDEILLSAFRKGGYSNYSLEDHQSALYATEIALESGVSEFSQTEVRKMLTGKQIRINPYIDEMSTGFSGRTTPKDLETALQLIYLYSTQPRQDKEAFETFVNKMKAQYANLSAYPQAYYTGEVLKTLSQNHPRAQKLPEPSDFDKINFQRVNDIFHDLFVNPEGYTYMFVGNFDVEKMKPLIETYLASIPAKNKAMKGKDLGIRPPSEVVEKDVKKGKDPKSMVYISFHGDFNYSKKEAYLMRCLSELLDITLIEQLREEKSGVYSARARSVYDREPYENYKFVISYPCAPENVSDLVATTFKEIKRIQNEGVKKENVEKIKEAQRREIETQEKENNFWLSQLQSKYYYGEEMKDIFDNKKKMVEELNAADLQKAAQRYFDFEQYAKIVLYPEE